VAFSVQVAGALPAVQGLAQFGQASITAPASPTTLVAPCLWASCGATLTWTSLRPSAPNRAREPVVKSCRRVPIPMTRSASSAAAALAVEEPVTPMAPRLRG
jgi:hypothetical protein